MTTAPGRKAPRVGVRRPARRAAWFGLGVALVLMAAGILVPALTDWNVHVKSFPPLHAGWSPRLGPGTVPAIVLAVAGVLYGPAAASRWPWRRLLLAAFGYGLVWLISLATVDGWRGIGHILNTGYEYLATARAVTDVSATLHEYVSRIPFHSEHNWPSHVAGHPPGALLFFVFLVRVGLGSGLAAGLVVVVVAATTTVAVLILLRRLGAERLARRAAPFLVLGPAAIWMAVSADAVFAAASAWGLCCLGFAATSRGGLRLVGWSVVAGLVLGYCVMMSYGLPLLGLLALAVLFAARSWRPLPWAAGAAVLVVLGFAAAGFAWWEAYPVLVQRYYDGVQRKRPYGYWLFGNLSALGYSAGPLVGASVGAALAGVRTVRGWGRSSMRPVSAEGSIVVLTVAALACILIADVSGMSKAEVERIWLPFVPWLLLGTASLPATWRRPGLALQLLTALTVQHLLATGW